MKNKKIIVFSAIVLIVLIGVGVGIYSLTKENKTNLNEKKSTNEIKKYGYTLDNLDTELYKSLFNELKNNLESNDIDNKEYAKSIAKMFIVDLYTINTKINKYDIGGTEFLLKESISNYNDNVTDTLYKYVEDNSAGKRNQELPEVKSIEVKDISETKFKLKNSENNSEKEYNAYKINLTWDYVVDYGYDTEAEIIVANIDKKLYVVEKN